MILWTFGHNVGKKSDTDMVEGLFEAYYRDKYEKLTKSEIWFIIGVWDQKLKFVKFSLKSAQMSCTQHWYLI